MTAIHIECEIERFNASHIRIAPLGKTVVISYGVLVDSYYRGKPHKTFKPTTYSTLELANTVFNGYGWNIDQLTRLVATIKRQANGQRNTPKDGSKVP